LPLPAEGRRPARSEEERGREGGWVGRGVEWICGWIGQQRLPVTLSLPLPSKRARERCRARCTAAMGTRAARARWIPVVEDSTDARRGRGREVDLRKAEQCRWEPG
jgi:hypothetical protein